MPFIYRRSALLVLCLLAAPQLSHAQASQTPTVDPTGAGRVTGRWQGVVSLGAFRERLGLVIAPDSSGALHGTMKALDQGGAEAPAAIVLKADTLSFTIVAEHITYVGVITAAGDSIRGTFVQGTTTLPLTFGRVTPGDSASVGRPQDPRPPFPYRAEDVTVPSVAGVILAGTVVIPNGKGPFPAVVFVTGSGPQDRNESLMGHQPFLVIADYLARHGIASLRYDDRGTAKSTGKFSTATSADFAVDAEAALRFLRTVPGVSRNRVGIIGHSEGGLIGPMIAARNPDAAFLVLMAGPGVRGDSISLLQLRRLAPANIPPQQVESQLATNRRIYSAVTGARDSADAFARLQAAKQDIISSLPDSARAIAASRLDRALPALVGPWMRFFLSYDPRIALRKVRVPVLALGGTLDQQVPAEENLSGIETALRAGGNKDYRVVKLPNLNHLFQTATTGAPSEYSSISETVSPQVLDLMASWINQRFGAKR